MTAKKVEHFLDWRKATNQAGTHKVNRLANSETPILHKAKYERGDINPYEHVGVITHESIIETMVEGLASVPKLS
jgi:hypothetical protein